VMNTSSNTIIATIPVGIAPGVVVFSLDSAFAYIINMSSNNVSVIDTAINSVIATIPVGVGPLFAAVTSLISGSINDVAQQAAVRQALELIYSQTARSLDDIQSTGLFPTFEGTYPDSINSYIIDSTTPFTIEMNLPPPWCP
jgi:YVTN family beta-propeller protein